jgi:predicted ATP-grasp superfamily ATP-dependent carboligase
MEEFPSAVLLYLSCTCLPVARSLGRRGISVFGIDKNKGHIGTKSRYIEFLGSPVDDEDLLKILLDFAARNQTKAVLYPLNDEYLLFLSRHKDKLSRHFWFPYPKECSLEQLVSKESMAAIFRALGISMPYTVVLREDSINELEYVGLTFPVLIKPNLQQRWLDNRDVTGNIGNRKVLLVNDLSSLKEYYRVLSKYDTVIAQEFIPGETKNLYYYVGYRNNRGEILVSFVGRKLRTFPDTMGSESFLQSIHNPRLCKLGEEILNKLNYVGPAGIDFKFDVRDQGFKVIEINCRLGISDGLPVTCGVDIPYIYYRDVQGMTVQPELEYKDNVYWWWFEKDIDWFREYKSKDGFTKSKLLKDFLTAKYSYAVYAGDDLRPFSYMVGNLVRRFLRKVVGKLGILQDFKRV